MVIATFGTVMEGAIDPIHKIATVCRKHKIWLHVDGAYGAMFLFTEEIKGKFPGNSHCFYTYFSYKPEYNQIALFRFCISN